MKQFDNIEIPLWQDLKQTLVSDSKVSIAASCFSLYAFECLKVELEQIKELRFIFTSPVFIEEKTPQEKREFYIPRINRERNLYGTEFEIKLKNQLSQRAIAKECADWIRRKVRFQSNTTQRNIQSCIHIRQNDNHIGYTPVNGFTTTDIGYKHGNYISQLIIGMEGLYAQSLIQTFNTIWTDKNILKDVTEEIIDSISTVYKENSPRFIYFVALYNIFKDFLEDISVDELPNEATGFKQSRIWQMLYNFQKDAASGIITKLEQYNGCILADSVGLGKTFTALAVIKYYQCRNRQVLVLCPKKLAGNWNTYKDNYLNNPIAEDRLNYNVLYHTDLNRKSGFSNGIDLARINWANYDLIVIDESHNFRNGGKIDYDDEADDIKENRYSRLLNQVLRPGVKTKVLMLSATPVNNRFNDLKNQLQLAYEGDSSQWDDKLKTNRPINDIFRKAQGSFNEWSKLPSEERTGERLLKMLDYDFFELLDSVTIARSRKHIERYYDTSQIGTFPKRKKPLSYSPPLTLTNLAPSYDEIFSQLMDLNLSVYTPTKFILPSKANQYAKINKDNEVNVNFTQASREEGIRRLMGINLMKRLESSVYSFQLTLSRIINLIESYIDTINLYEKGSHLSLKVAEFDESNDWGAETEEANEFKIGKKVKIDLDDMDYLTWRDEMLNDLAILDGLRAGIRVVTPDKDTKLQQLLKVIDSKLNAPINPGNQKLLIFTAFADTAKYLYEHVKTHIREHHGKQIGLVVGSDECKTSLPKLKSDFNTILTCFSPLSKDKKLLMPKDKNELDVLIATDCISEGQNLQDCDFLINYDIHWNPVRIVQRFGRIDRIGSKNECIQMVNFWPDISLDAYIDLKGKVETRMKIVDMTATGDDNPLSDEEIRDLNYRKKQLDRLQNEIVDLEDMNEGVSIMDLGLNEFRLDLLEYIKNNKGPEHAPLGLHAVVAGKGITQPGVLFILRNTALNSNADNGNLLHPFYLVYMSPKGEVLLNHTESKKTFDIMRLLCREHDKPLESLCRRFNRQTDDGKQMQLYSDLLNGAISSIVQEKDKLDVDNFLTSKSVSFLQNQIKGAENFELICFLVVQD